MEILKEIAFRGIFHLLFRARATNFTHFTPRKCSRISTKTAIANESIMSGITDHINISFSRANSFHSQEKKMALPLARLSNSIE
jgi:hypothetical protein